MNQQFYVIYVKKGAHTACIGIEEIQYENLKRSPLPWYCSYCITGFPFSSVNNKDLHSLANFINKKDPILKEEFHTNYKKYRNLLSTLMKKSKQAYYDKYFERNWNNIKNTWKGIKSLISLKTVASNVPTVLSIDNGDTITNPYDIANTFNNYFASVAETTKKHKIFT